MRKIGYARISTDDQNLDCDSLTAALRILERSTDESVTRTPVTDIDGSTVRVLLKTTHDLFQLNSVSNQRIDAIRVELASGKRP